MKLKLFSILLGGVAMLLMTSCEESYSYADLLRDERRACNSFLSGYEIVDEIPSDTVFEVGPDAPFYKLDPDGNVYMQVLVSGSKDKRPSDDQPVYFRFMRLDLNYLYTDGVEFWEGNAENMMADPTYFLYNNYTLNSSAYYGYGLQMPLQFIGLGGDGVYPTKVNLLVKSQYGFTDEISDVVGYLYNITYYDNMIGGGSED
ncbi:MAG: DUF4827 domain-containing protein [Bacteroidales bacterium]|nr:DUF4827 domain-containing protein [Bacteroidales bacterium]